MSKQLKKLRHQLDKIDEKLLKILVDRFKITKKVGEYKAKHSLPAYDKKRETELFKGLNSLAKKLGLNQNLVKEIFQIIIKTVKINHKKAKRNKE